jgi:hypothetical protein
MKRTSLVILQLLLCCMFCTNGAFAEQAEEFKKVELDQFIEQQKKTVQGKKKTITMAAPVSFSAKMKRFPEEKQMSYIYQAMEVSGVNPLPEVNHRMFIESAEGRIIPVYVEKQTVEKLQRGLKEDQKANFVGYHVYNYSKGPAVLVVDFTPVQ